MKKIISCSLSFLLLLQFFYFVPKPQEAKANGWVTNGESNITINSTNYDAYCSKTTGLCDFYNKSGEQLFQNAGDIYVGEWEGDEAFGQYKEKFDENYIKKRDYTVSASNLSENGSTATVTFTQTKPSEVKFDTIYTFYQDDSKVLVNGKITYLSEKKITNEIIETGIPNAYSTTAIDLFEPAILVNDTQHDAMENITGWSTTTLAVIETNTDPTYIKEGSGSIKLTFNDDNDGATDWNKGMSKSFTAINYTGKTHLSFWVYPLQRLRLLVTLYNASGSKYTYSNYFLPNQWSLFQWDFVRSVDFVPEGVYRITILANDNSSCFPPPSATVYIDDIRFSGDIENGLMSAIGDGDMNDYWHSSSATTFLDSQFYNQGNASLKWANLDASSSDATLRQNTSNYSARANPNLPTDISDYDYVVFDAYTTCNVNLGPMLWDTNGNSKYNGFNIPTNTWQTIKWDFKNDYAGSQINHSAIRMYEFYVWRAAGSSDCNIWFDNLHLVKLQDDYSVFDGQTGTFSETGKAVKYSPRVFKMNDQTYIYGDNFGASNIEYMKKNVGDKTLDAFITKVDMHNFNTMVDRSGNYQSFVTYYKEVTKGVGEVSQGTIVYDFQTSQPTEIIKSRWPRNFRAAYTISDDDLLLKEARAYYYGTSDTLSADYGKKGIVVHNLRTSKNLWATDAYWNDAGTKSFMDSIYKNGIEIAIHGTGNTNRSEAGTVLDRVVNAYGTRQWLDHTTNTEGFSRIGGSPIVDGSPNDYYRLDLLKERNFKYVWSMTNPMTSAGTANLFYDGYKDVWPLPYRNSLIDATGGDTPIYLFGRTWGTGYDEYLQVGGGGNTTELQSIIDANGLVNVYTHDHIGYYNTVGSDYVLKSGADDVFSWLEGKQNDGTLWIDTVSNVLDWMLDNENVVITAQSGNSFTVKNNNSNAISGVTLSDLNNNIQYAKIGDAYQIYVDGTYVVLPKFTASEQKIVQIISGTYSSSLPKLTSVPVHVNIDNAAYNADTGIVSLIFDYAEPCDTSYVACDASTKAITPVVQNYRHPFFNSTINSINTITSSGSTTLSATLTADPTTFNAVGMEITPSASSVDVVVDTWNTTSTYYKKWTESAASSTITTAHTIGDLRANQYYQVKVGGTVLQTLQANGSGTISFTYSGGYSTKTFEVEEIPTAPTISTPTVLSSNSIRWNFTDNSDNETGFRVYTNVDAIATSSAIANLTYLTETGLSENTQYTRYVKAYNSYGESASSSATSTYTLANTPTGLTTINIADQSITVSVDTLPNATSGSSGYYFSQGSHNSGWIQTNSWQDTGLGCSNNYTYSVKYRNGNGAETSAIYQTFRTPNCAGAVVIPPQIIQQTNTTQPQSPQPNQPTSNPIPNIPITFSFQAGAKQGTIDQSVKYLQIILNQYPDTQLAKSGVGSPGKETNFFGPKTKQAVIKFQEKYKDEILKPWGLTKGTGIIGKTTKAKLNQLLGK